MVYRAGDLRVPNPGKDMHPPQWYQATPGAMFCSSNRDESYCHLVDKARDASKHLAVPRKVPPNKCH